MRKFKKAIALSLCIAMLGSSAAFAADSPEKQDIAGATAVSATYNGKNQKPVIKLGGKTLTASDYVITSTGTTKDAGTYKISIKGTGNYKGTATVTYKIAPKAITVASSAKSLVYTAKSQTTSVKVYSYSKHAYLTEGTDYTVSGVTHTAPGKYTVTIKGKGNYSFTKTSTYYIRKDVYPKNVKATATSKTFNHKTQATTVKVTYGSKTLKKGTDYTVSGTTKAKWAGTYYVKITGKGLYTGTKTIKYTIKKASQKVTAKVSGNKLTYSGNKTAVTVKTNNTGVTVKNGKIVVSKKVKKGTKVAITVKAKESPNYKASAAKTVYYTVK